MNYIKIKIIHLKSSFYFNYCLNKFDKFQKLFDDHFFFPTSLATPFKLNLDFFSGYLASSFTLTLTKSGCCSGIYSYSYGFSTFCSSFLSFFLKRPAAFLADASLVFFFAAAASAFFLAASRFFFSASAFFLSTSYLFLLYS